MTKEEWEARYEEFVSRIELVLNEFGDLVGPRLCAIHGDDLADCDHDPWESEMSPADGSIVTEGVICTNWTLMSNGESYYDYLHPIRMLQSHVIGLLRAGTVAAERFF